MVAVSIATGRTPAELRALARRERDGRVSARLLALANALDGMSRDEAARAAGMDRQTLRDWVHRYNAEGVAGLRDRPRPGRPCGLDEGQQALSAGERRERAVAVDVGQADPPRAVVGDRELAGRASPVGPRPGPHVGGPGDGHFLPDFSAGCVVASAATKASGGTSTEPMFFMRFLPAFCFSSSLRLRLMSPP